MVSLTKRQRNLIEYLHNCDDYVTLDRLSKKFNVAKRTIQNDLNVIETFLNDNNYKLVKKPGVGILIKANKEILDLINIEDNKYLDKEERIKNIVTYLLVHNKTTYKDIGDSLGISRQTVLNSMDEVKNYFKENNIEISANKAKGIFLIGKEEDIRQAYIKYIYKGKYLNDKRALELLNELKENYNLRFSCEKYVLSIVSFIFIRADEKHFINSVKRNIDNKEYYELINKYFDNVDEANYLGNYLLNERLNEISRLDKSDKEAKEISEYLINGLTKGKQEINEEFKEGLTHHIHCALYRIRNHIEVENDLLDVIRYTMPVMYVYTAKQLGKVKDQYNVAFNEIETSFITMYLSNIYEKNKDEGKLKILVVCTYGIASSSILKNRIISKIPNIEVLGPVVVDELDKYIKDVDLVLSTIDLKDIDKPVVVINPLLNNDDIMNVNNKIDEFYFKKRCEELMDTQTNNEKHYLKEYIKDEDIKIVDDVNDWRSAIRLASASLLAKKLIKESYVEEMVNAVDKYGPYMVLSEGTAYVHAGKNDGINDNCTSLLISKKPIKFGDSNTKIINNIVVLGMKDDDVDMLNVVYILNIKENIEKLKNQKININIVKELSN